MNKNKNTLKRIIKYIYMFITCIIFGLLIYSVYCLDNITFDQLWYSMVTSEGTSINAVIPGFLFVTIITIILFILLCILNHHLNKKNNNICFKRFNIHINKILCTSLLLLFTLIIGSITTGLLKYMYYQNNKSNFIRDNYILYDKNNVTFPKKKQNLIYIVVESLENSGESIKSGGQVLESYIPNLEQLQKDNINFSNTSYLGGGYVTTGGSWTAAALISEMSGTPLKLLINVNKYSGFASPLYGVTSIGDILKENGYTNYFMLGSDADFGGRKEYFKAHGDYEIYDYYWAIKESKIEKDYFKWWGYEDAKLYEYAKEKLTTISENSKPFNFTMLTADTHFTDGFVDEACDDKFDSNYANSYYCTDKMLTNFIAWIQKQDFYENTTIVITGDHLTMQNNFYKGNATNRTVYNAFINSRVETEYSKNREFTTLDMFPTSLAALGVTIKGDRLALGTNLFSGEKTYTEEYGLKYLTNELIKSSSFYNETLLGNKYNNKK